MSKLINERSDLSVSSLNQIITESVFFHWFSFVELAILELMRWRICLLIIPISDFDGFISLHVGLLLKLGLWSFSVMKEFLVARETPSNSVTAASDLPSLTVLP